MEVGERYDLINSETGEIVDIKSMLKTKGKSKVNKTIIDAMLEQADNIGDIDKDLLYVWLKVTKEVNAYGQFKLIGEYRNSEFERRALDDIIVFGYINRILMLAHPFTCALMKNRQTKIETWTEMWEAIDCKNKLTQRKVKKFIADHNIVREGIGREADKTVKFKNLYFNPFLLRKASYISQISINCFKDCAKESQNISSYVYRFLQCIGVLDSYDIKEVQNNTSEQVK